MTGADESPCPSCGEPVPVALAPWQSGEQSGDRIGCPHCGAPLERAIDGHVDAGWRLVEAPAG